MVPELVNNHDPHVCLRVCYTIEMFRHRRFLSSLMRNVVSVTINSTVEFLFRLAYGLLATPPTRTCGASRHKTCPILLATDKFSGHTTGQHLKTKVHVNASCKSSNVIYLITCGWSCQQYVGETEQEFHCRINSHRYDIALKRTKESPLAEHFNGIAHSQVDTRVMVIDQLWNHDRCLRKTRESRWIRTLGTTHPLGMNLRVDSLRSLLPLTSFMDLCESLC